VYRVNPCPLHDGSWRRNPAVVECARPRAQQYQTIESAGIISNSSFSISRFRSERDKLANPTTPHTSPHAVASLTLFSGKRAGARIRPKSSSYLEPMNLAVQNCRHDQQWPITPKGSAGFPTGLRWSPNENDRPRLPVRQSRRLDAGCASARVLPAIRALPINTSDSLAPRGANEERIPPKGFSRIEPLNLNPYGLVKAHVARFAVAGDGSDPACCATLPPPAAGPPSTSKRLRNKAPGCPVTRGYLGYGWPTSPTSTRLWLRPTGTHPQALAVR
jgi:hypothetical protein